MKILQLLEKEVLYTSMFIFLINVFIRAWIAYLGDLFEIAHLCREIEDLKQDINGNKRASCILYSIVQKKFLKILEDEINFCYPSGMVLSVYSVFLKAAYGVSLPSLIAGVWVIPLTPCLGFIFVQGIWNIREDIFELVSCPAREVILKGSLLAAEKKLFGNQIFKELSFEDLPVEEGIFFLTKVWS